MGRPAIPVATASPALALGLNEAAWLRLAGPGRVAAWSSRPMRKS